MIAPDGPMIGWEGAYNGLSLYCDELGALLKDWVKDYRAAAAIAKDCDGMDDCRCLYCRTQRALGFIKEESHELQERVQTPDPPLDPGEAPEGMGADPERPPG